MYVIYIDICYNYTTLSKYTLVQLHHVLVP